MVNMEAKNLPNQKNQSKYNCGMFDEDQRTTKSLPHKLQQQQQHQLAKTTNNNIIVNNNLNDNLINFNYNNFTDNQLCYKLFQNKQTLPLTNNFNANCDTTNILSSSNLQPSHCYRTKILRLHPKKLNTFIICIFFWIVFQQNKYTALAKPIARHHHHIMANGSGGKNNYILLTDGDDVNDSNVINRYSKQCMQFFDIIEKIQILTEEAYKEIYSKRLNDYTMAVASQDHHKYHAEWKDHHNPNLSPEEGRLTFDNYHEPPPDDVFQHLYRGETSEREKTIGELTNLYKRLKIIKLAISEIIDGKESETDINPEKMDLVKEFFKAQSNAASEILQEIEMSLKTLSVTVPQVLYRSSDTRIGNFDWLATREHLKLLAYAKKAYKILYELCK